MAIRQLLVMGALVAATAPALAQTYTFSCQPDARTVDGRKELISLGDQFLGVDRRVFSFDEKLGKACEVDMQARACSKGPLWTGAADATFTRISFTRERPNGASIDVVGLMPGSGIFSASILEHDRGEVKYSGECKALTSLAVKLPQ